MSTAGRRILSSVVAIAVIAVVAGLWILRGPGPMDFADGPKVALADYHGANPTGVPAALAQASLVERGAYLARAADCEACHTTQDGKPYAGGLPFKLPFGTLYSTNITPTRKPGSAITAIRIFSTRFIAASATTARGFIRRCRLRPTPI